MKKHVLNFASNILALVLILGSTLTAQASQNTNYPSVPYEDPFRWTEEKKSAYPCTDEGTYYLPEERIDNTANFYIYMEDSNYSFTSNQVYASEILLWRPVESEGKPIQNDLHMDRAFAETELLALKLNPYNLAKIETLPNGSVYYIQYGIPNGYYTANGSSYVNTRGYITILTPEFGLSESYANAYAPSNEEETSHAWLLSNNSDLTFCAIYGSEDWCNENISEFQEWCKSYQAETGKLSSNVPTYAEIVSSKPQENTDVSEETAAIETKEAETEQNSNPSVEQVIEIQEKTEQPAETADFSTKPIVAIAVVGVSALALLIIKIRERRK